MSEPNTSHICTSAIIGAGAWGLALSHVLSTSNHSITLITKAEHVQTLKRNSTNSDKLANYKIPKTINISDDRTLLNSTDVIFLVIPAKAILSEIQSWQNLNLENKKIILCSKGLDKTNAQFFSKTLQQTLPNNEIGILSGPSFAQDVAAGLPTAVTLAFENIETAKDLAHKISNPQFRLYYSDDILGVEVGGVVKNVLAIAAGIVEGAALGSSAKAATITRGFAELVRFGEALGAKSSTLAGLSGLGDLILTASSKQSRNFSLGLAIGQKGQFLPEMEKLALAEGFYTAPALLEQAHKLGIDMPLVEAVCAILNNKIDVKSAIHALLTRPQKSEQV